MLDESEDNRLDQSLRDTFDDFNLPPEPRVWTGIEARLAMLPPPTLPVRQRPLPLPFLFTLTALLAGLGGWLLPRGEAPGQLPALAGQLPATAKTTEVPLRGTAGPKNTKQVPVLSAAASVKGLGVPPLASAAPVTQGRVPVLGSAAPVTRPGMPVLGAAAPTVPRSVPSFSAAAPITSGYAPVHSAVAPVLASVAPEAGAVVPVGGGLAAATAPDTIVVRAAVPARLRPLVALHESRAAVATLSAEEARTRQLASLRAERAELLRLQIHTDSLLVVLGEVPVAAPGAATAANAPAAPEPADTALALGRRWSLLLAAAPEQNALTLEGPDDQLTALRRGRETGRPGVNAALLAEYRLNRRLSMGAGLGYSAFGTELRINSRRTEVDVTYNTSTSTSFTAVTSVNQTHSIREVPVPVLNPIFNTNGQVLGYDTVYVIRQDTVFTTTVLHDTVRTTTNLTTPVLTRREVTTNTTLRPNYRFVTLPVLLRYRITPPGSSRWWTDVALGAQLQLFLGGTQAVTEDGLNFRTQTITPGSGPFRTLNLALSGSLALNYALTERLSVSAAPSLRWQALSLYKAETGLRQQPTATGLLLGVRFKL